MPLDVSNYMKVRDKAREQPSDVSNQRRQASQSRPKQLTEEIPEPSEKKSMTALETRNVDLASLKVPIPNTLLQHQPPGPLKDTRTAFDDTQSFNFDDESSFSESRPGTPFNERTLTVQSEYNRKHSRTQPQKTFDPSSREVKVPFDENHAAPLLPGNWRDLVDQERQLQGIKPRYTNFQINSDYPKKQNNEYNDSEYPGDYINDNVDDLDATPLRTKSVIANSQNPSMDMKLTHRPMSEPIGTEKEGYAVGDEQVYDRPNFFDQGEPIYDSHLKKATRFKIHKQAEPIQVNELANPSELSTTAKLSSKVSSYQESSSEEEHLPIENTPKHKRHLSELDYDSEQLKSMTFSDLNKTPFLIDPRQDPASTPALYMNGNPVTLTQKLNNLSKMATPDQITMFKSLTDTENEQVPFYFLEQIKELMNRQMTLKLERRKIALKYEMEIAKRQTLVELKSRDVDDELQDLRKGGNELIEGRKSIAVLSTPKKT